MASNDEENSVSTWWQSLDSRRKGAFALFVAILLAGFLATAWWGLRVEQAVLFSELRPQDAATITAELDKLKVPYGLADGGGTVMVDAAQVHAVRLKLMARDLPLHGTVGLEIFNHTDFGMTEFAQRVNYQRALQGELTRTFLSFPEIRDARVHLALPEQGLFKQVSSRPKAAITLSMRQGQSLRREQIAGMQRLVAAAVTGLAAAEVTIVDQHGAALSRAEEEDEAAGGNARLDLKRDMENYLSRKVAAVLDQAFGAGQALASVDVTLNMEHVRITTEDVLPASDGRAGLAAGVLVRERESARDTATPDVRGTDGRAARGSSTQRDVEYQAGRRVEHVVSHPGAIRRLQVVAVVRQALSEEQRVQIRALVAAAAGASPERGDGIVVQSLAPAGAVAAENRSMVQEAQVGEAAPTTSTLDRPDIAWAIAGCLSLLMIVAGAWQRGRTRSARPRELTAEQRNAALQRIQVWLLEGEDDRLGQSAARRGP